MICFVAGDLKEIRENMVYVVTLSLCLCLVASLHLFRQKKDHLV